MSSLLFCSFPGTPSHLQAVPAASISCVPGLTQKFAKSFSRIRSSFPPQWKTLVSAVHLDKVVFYFLTRATPHTVIIITRWGCLPLKPGWTLSWFNSRHPQYLAGGSCKHPTNPAAERQDADQREGGTGPSRDASWDLLSRSRWG